MRYANTAIGPVVWPAGRFSMSNLLHLDAGIALSRRRLQVFYAIYIFRVNFGGVTSATWPAKFSPFWNKLKFFSFFDNAIFNAPG
jgi:hypothetical protein